MKTRREFLITLGAGALAAPWTSLAQQASGKARRIAFLGMATASTYTPHVEVFKAGLRDAGYREGKDIAIEYRYADGKYERLAELAAELVRMKPDVIVTHGTPATAAAKKATSSIPVVMVSIADPVASGLVASLGRPGGNLTGLSNLQGDVVAKHMELLAQVLPGRAVFAVLRNPTNPGASEPQLKQAEAGARSLGLRLQSFDAGSAGDITAAFSAMASARMPGAVVLSDPLFLEEFRQIAELALKYRIATVSSRSEGAEAGGLMSYGSSLLGMFRQAAVYVDRIFKGAKPADLPVEQPTKFELVVNMKTAKALGFKLPPSVLVRADRVIE